MNDGRNESQAGKVAAAVILSPAFAGIFVALRLYARFILCKKRFLEDYCIIVAMVFSLGLSVCMGIPIINGFGRHIETVTPEELLQQQKASVGGIFFYIVTHMFVKMSILLQYVRISVMHIERRICYFFIAFLVLQTTANVIVSLLSCIPLEALWKSGIPGAKCLNRQTAYFTQLGFLIATDILVLILPLFILRHLTLPWPQKLGLTVILAFGAMACIISILRLRTVTQSVNSTDSTWDKVTSAVFGVIEPNLGIFCASVVTLRPLVAHIAEKARRHFPRRVQVSQRGHGDVRLRGGPFVRRIYSHERQQNVKSTQATSVWCDEAVDPCQDGQTQAVQKETGHNEAGHNEDGHSDADNNQFGHNEPNHNQVCDIQGDPTQGDHSQAVARIPENTTRPESS